MFWIGFALVILAVGILTWGDPEGGRGGLVLAILIGLVGFALIFTYLNQQEDRCETLGGVYLYREMKCVQGPTIDLDNPPTTR